MQTLTTGSFLQHKSYRIDKVLGQGGFGITYLATDINLQRKVAIKEFFPKDFCQREDTTSHVTLGTQNTADFVNRLKAKFLKEARNIAKFNHPNIIRIHAAFEENNTAYYVMEYIEGESISEKVKRDGPIVPALVLEYIEKIGSALDYVHARKINHLDVKPANIMIRRSDNTPILIDFGLSKQYDTEGNETSTTPTGISHGYAPMEQYNACGVKEFSPQTDVYSLAATLYYLLSGVVPPQAPRLVDEELTFPATIPVNMIGPISKAMKMGRRNRHETVDRFIADLKSADGKPNPNPATEPNPNTKVTQGYINDHEWVDLGLPSGLKWATCNLGALSPEEYGEYFAWGETKLQSSYDCESSRTSNRSISDLRSAAILDTVGNLTLAYDAARANWGGSWRMPTKAEMDELKEKCTWTWISQDGHYGCRVTGPNGNSIFLPAAGWHGGSSLHDAGDNGDYWSSSCYEDGNMTFGLFFDNGHQYVIWYNRHYGRTVRAVSE